MKKSTVIVLTFILFLFVLFTKVGFCQTNDQFGEFQKTILNFYTQQLVAHGSTLFAASTASFLFITRMIKRVDKKGRWSKFIFVIFSALLLTFVIYTGFRLMYYGRLANGAIKLEPLNNITSLQDFHSKVRDYTILNMSSTMERNLSANFDMFCIGDLRAIEITNGVTFSFILGLFLSYLFFWAFGPESVSWKYPFCLFLPVFLGGILALGINRYPYDPNTTLYIRTLSGTVYPVFYGIFTIFRIIRKK